MPRRLRCRTLHDRICSLNSLADVLRVSPRIPKPKPTAQKQNQDTGKIRERTFSVRGQHNLGQHVGGPTSPVKDGSVDPALFVTHRGRREHLAEGIRVNSDTRSENVAIVCPPSRRVSRASVHDWLAGDAKVSASSLFVQHRLYTSIYECLKGIHAVSLLNCHVGVALSHYSYVDEGSFSLPISVADRKPGGATFFCIWGPDVGSAHR